MAEALLDVCALNVAYGHGASEIHAVVDVDLVVHPGEFVAVVGESGCGKSTLCFAIAQLLPRAGRITSGEVIFKGQNLVTLRDRELRRMRWRAYAVVMQSAMNALNPVLRIGDQFRDVFLAHGVASRNEARQRAAEALEMVGIAPSHVDSYPHQLSGGMRQRAMVAMALAFTPDLLIMDEPTSALDVVAQRALMHQIKRLQDTIGFAIIFVTHDMSIVSRFSDRIAVMYAGEIVEQNATTQLFDALHPYTVALLQSFPSISNPTARLEGIPGAPPDLRTPVPGCRFAARCQSVMDVCHTDHPGLRSVQDATVRCHLYEIGTGRRHGN